MCMYSTWRLSPVVTSGYYFTGIMFSAPLLLPALHFCSSSRGSLPILLATRHLLLSSS